MKEKWEMPNIEDANSRSEKVSSNRRKMNVARKIILNGMLALGLVGFMPDSAAEAQNVSEGQKTEEKSEAFHDVFHARDFLTDFNKMQSGETSPELKKKLRISLTEKYGSSAVALMENLQKETEKACAVGLSTRTCQHALNRVEFTMDVLYDQKLGEAVSRDKESGYVFTDYEIRTQRMIAEKTQIPTLIEFARVTVQNEDEAKKMAGETIKKLEADIANNKQISAEKFGNISIGENGEEADIFIKGDSQHPGFYEIKARGYYEKQE